MWGHLSDHSQLNFNAPLLQLDFHEMQTNLFTPTLLWNTFQIIGVKALEAASPLLNLGKGCGRLVKEHKQL